MGTERYRFCFLQKAFPRLMLRPWSLTHQILLPLAALSLASCSSLVEEEYKDVRRETKTQFKSSTKWMKPQSAETVIKVDWWKAMGDTEFDGLIQEASKTNIDLKLLVFRLKKAGVELTGAKRDLLPKFNAGAGYSATRTLNNGRTTGNSAEQFSVSSGISWEMDFWGRLKQQKQSQWAAYQATESDWRAGFLGLVSNVSRGYITIRQLDEQLALHSESLQKAEGILNIYKKRERGGIESSSKINNQTAEVLRLKRELMELQRQRDVTQNEVAFLLGQPAGTFTVSKGKLRNRMTLMALPKEINVNLLERRPDIIAAESRVKHAYHMRESDRAARLPRLSLGLSANLSSAAINALTQNWTAAILPKIEFPGLDNRTKVRLEISEIEAEEARENYKKTVLKAIKDVENSLINIRNRMEQATLEVERIKELSASQKKTEMRYKGGLISQLEIFEVERSFLGAQQKGLDLYSQLLKDMVDLHNALGGGW